MLFMTARVCTFRRVGCVDYQRVGKLVITPWQEDNGYAPLENPETYRKAKPGE